jgi:NAD-dependent DNA ligase
MIDGLAATSFEKILANQKLYNLLSTKPWAILDPVNYNISAELYTVLGDAIYKNTISSIEQINKTKTIAHFISGLGLPGISYKTALRLCQYIKSGSLNIPVSKKAITSFLEGITIFNGAKNEMKNFQFAGLPNRAKAIYCITGTLSQSREAMIEYFSEQGYEFSANVTRETNYLVVGAAPGKLKIRAAEKYNIPQITEEQFIKLIAKEKD